LFPRSGACAQPSNACKPTGGDPMHIEKHLFISYSHIDNETPIVRKEGRDHARHEALLETLLN
jgi:hypothetical protein